MVKKAESTASTTFVDLFCGAGGLTLGLKNAGWTPVWAIDASADAISTYSKAFRDHRSECRDIQLIDQFLFRPAYIIDEDI